MTITMTVVAILAYFEKYNQLIFVMMVFLAGFQITLGTYTWVYLGQVASDEGLSVATFTLWLFVLVCAIWTGSVFEALTSTGTFALFASFCLLSFFGYKIFLRETKGLTRDEAQAIYAVNDEGDY